MYVLSPIKEQKTQTKGSGIKFKTSLKVFAILFSIFAIGTAGAYLYGSKVIEDINAVFVSHTEYWLDDTAMIIVRLTNYQGQPITGATCNASLIYQNDVYQFQKQPMSASTLAGNYYYSFYLNSTTYSLGVYTKQVDCFVGVKNRTITTTLHVNPALEYLKTIGANVTGTSVYLNEINQTAYNVYNDTQYISSNMVTATNFEAWKNNATVRFDNIDGNLTVLQNYCSNAETNSSVLCQEIYNIRSFQESTNVTYTQYFSDLNTTTTNTWNYMTGTLATNINNIYSLLLGVNTTVTNIQENVTAIRQDQLDDINLVIIS